MVKIPWTSVRENRICHFNASMNSLVSYWRPRNNYPVILMFDNPWKVILCGKFVRYTQIPVLEIRYGQYSEIVANS